MAFSALSNTWTQWFTTYRPGHAAAGTPGTALVSDLQANDYLCGTREKVVSTGTTTGGIRQVTVQRHATGAQYTVGLVAASSLLIIRP